MRARKGPGVSKASGAHGVRTVQAPAKAAMQESRCAIEQCFGAVRGAPEMDEHWQVLGRRVEADSLLWRKKRSMHGPTGPTPRTRALGARELEVVTGPH